MKVKLNNVRLSFPSLFEKATFNGEVGKYEATFLLCKESQSGQIEKLGAAVQKMIKEVLKTKLPQDKTCLKDGDHIPYDGYEGMMSIKASNNKRPMVVDADRSPLTADDDKLYAGCYVNVIIELWAQDNSWGKRVNANLLGVQFAKDGEPFGDGVGVSVDDFDILEDDEEDDDLSF